MKRIFLFLAVAASIFISACGNDLELFSEAKDAPAVYGFLEPYKEYQYIRVERVFQTGGQSAFEVAKNPDSVYYGPNVLVQLEDVASGQKFTLERVNAVDLGFIRENGIFPTDPNIIYRIKTDALGLAFEKKYNLLIDRGSNFPLVKASTMVLDTAKTTGAIANGSSPALSLDFTGLPIRMGVANAKGLQIFDIKMEIHYRERLPGQDIVEKVIPVEISKGTTFEGGINSTTTIEYSNNNFYAVLANNIEPVTDALRVMGNIVITVDGGGPALAEYRRILNANLGVTSSEDPPIYSNIENGVGLFDSRSQWTRSYNISSKTLEEIQTRIETRNLGF